MIKKIHSLMKIIYAVLPMASLEAKDLLDHIIKNY